jgi:TPR repeat protein
MYRLGQGVPQNDVQAATWYRKASAQGLAAAQNDLGLMYVHGRGVPQDDAQAKAWYLKAAAQGNANALNNLRHLEQHR